LATAVLIASFHPSVNGVVEALVLTTFAIGIASIACGAPGPRRLGEVAGTLFGTVYAGLLTGCIVGIRWLPPDRAGRSWIVFLLAVIFLSDTAAYYVGSALGKHALAPAISPKKTVEGLVAGLAAAGLAAALVSHWLRLDLGLRGALGLGVGLAALGVAGDLFESMLKRSAGVKDASALMPGHGGVLDRLDSLLFAGPGLLLYLRVGASG
jgi:phosphatidate cytidylyltransferase